MVLFLANAVYFKGKWEAAFELEATELRPFYLDSRRLQEVQAETMHRRGEMIYAENEELQAVKLPFKGDVAMIVILPKETISLDAIESKLSHAYLSALARSFFPSNVSLFLPKFTMQSSYDLRETLAQMGMSRAFTSSADFSGISSEQPLMLSYAVHKGFIDVDEQGAEAAAATGVGASRSSVSIPVEFRADRPFVFLIQTKNNLPLFIGRIVNPTVGRLY